MRASVNTFIAATLVLATFAACSGLDDSKGREASSGSGGGGPTNPGSGGAGGTSGTSGPGGDGGSDSGGHAGNGGRAGNGGMPTGGDAGMAGTPGTGTAGHGGTAGTGGATGTAGTGGTAGSGGTGGGSAGNGGAGIGGSGGASSSAVCTRWKADRADLSEGTWSGAAATCNAGDTTAAARANALRQVNLYRFLAGLPPVTEDATQNQHAQVCALMMEANKMLSHAPPSTWACYTSAGATAASQSNIATAAGVRAIGLYITDRGNETTHGHRRWILSNSLGPLGMGSASGYSCLLVAGGTGRAGKAFIAWPPDGDVPLQALNVGGAFDSVGWLIQSDTINLASAQVTVTDAGNTLPVTSSQLPAGYGSRYALRFVPSGWTTTAGHTYAVAVTGTTPPINYTVSVVSCP